MWWFDQLADLVPNHVITRRPEQYPGGAAGRQGGAARALDALRRLSMLPVECVARGYLTGSGLAEYRETGTVCGVALPPGLVDGSRLDRADLHPGDEGRGRRARREHRLRATWPSAVGAEPPPRSCAT